MEDLEGFSEMRRKFLESLPVEERLAGLRPEERLAGLTRDQLITALPDDVLQWLPNEILSTLSAGAREVVRKRIGR